MTIFTDNRLLASGLIGGTLSRHRGNMQEVAAQQPVYQDLSIPPEKILHFHQTHSDTIVPVLTEQDARRVQQAPVQDADAWLLAVTGWGAAIQTADCVPLFLWDENARVFALAHCGWRGVVKRLPFKTAQALKQAGAAGTMYGWLGPHIQVCCFEVQEDVAAQFSPTSLHHKNGKIFVNLNLEILRQLEEAGLNPQEIKTPYYCTCGDKENFFSWRRDHIRQNLLSFIYKP
ncbi:MAG: polyphenol oxidase family protein [Elusimicrobiaceae bacterium]|nr:polyphenol oxidase family protein [Elusimicrobiaceae bacterium]